MSQKIVSSKNGHFVYYEPPENFGAKLQTTAFLSLFVKWSNLKA